MPLLARTRLAIDHVTSEIGGTGITLAAFEMHEIGVVAKTVRSILYPPPRKLTFQCMQLGSVTHCQ